MSFLVTVRLLRDKWSSLIAFSQSAYPRGQKRFCSRDRRQICLFKNLSVFQSMKNLCMLFLPHIWINFMALLLSMLWSAYHGIRTCIYIYMERERFLCTCITNFIQPCPNVKLGYLHYYKAVLWEMFLQFIFSVIISFEGSSEVDILDKWVFKMLRIWKKLPICFPERFYKIYFPANNIWDPI